MKVYLFSDVPGGGDDITEALDRANVNIIAKEGKMDVDMVARNMAKIMQESMPNLFIFVTDNSVEAGIELNKLDHIRAAVCASYEDVTAARKQNANVLIVQDTCTKKPEIAEAVVGGQSFTKMMFNPIRNDKKRNVEPKEVKPIEVKKVKKTNETDDSDNLEDVDNIGDTHKSGKGIFGKLKESLGIMD